MEYQHINHQRHEEAGWLLEPHACPLCAETDEQVVCQVPQFQFFADKPTNRITLTQVACVKCGLCRMNPIYSERGYAYLFQEAGASFGSSQAAELAPWVRARTPGDTIYQENLQQGIGRELVYIGQKGTAKDSL